MKQFMIDKNYIWLMAVYVIFSFMVIPYITPNIVLGLILSDIPLMIIFYSIIHGIKNNINNFNVIVGLGLGIVLSVWWIKEITIRTLPLTIEDTLIVLLIKYITLLCCLIVSKYFYV